MEQPVAPPQLSSFNPWPLSGVEASLDRMYRVSTIVWSSASAQDTQLAEIKFPEALLSIAILKDRMKYFKFFRGGVKVRVEVESPPMNGGSIGVAPYPFYDSTVATSVRHLTAYQRAQVHDFRLISASGGSVTEFVIPWKANQPFMHVANMGVTEKAITGTLFIHVWDQLNQPGAATVTCVINVYAQLVDYEFAGYMPSVIAPLAVSYGTEGVERKDLRHEPSSVVRSRYLDKPQSTKKEASTRSEKGVLSSIARATGLAAGSLSVIPGLEPLGVVSKVASVGSSMLENLGLDQPSSVMAPQPTYPANLQPYTHGLAPVTRMSETPGTSAAGTDGLFIPSEKNPSFVQIAQRPGIVYRGVFDDTITADSAWVHLNCHPMVVPYTTSGGFWQAHPTPLAIASVGFSGWRGTLKYLFNFRCPGLTKGRVRFVIQPDGGTPPASIESIAGDVISKIVDIDGDTDVEISVPFIYERMYSQVATEADFSSVQQMFGAHTYTPPQNFVSSRLSMYIMVPPRAYNNGSADVGVTVWAAAGSDYQLFKPLGTRGYVTSTYVATDQPLDKAQCSISPREIFAKGDFATFLPVTRVTDNKVIDSDPPTGPHVLARRPYAVYDSGNSNFAGVNYTLVYPWVYGGGKVLYPWLYALMLCFRGFKGSLRGYPLIYSNSNSNGAYNTAVIPGSSTLNLLSTVGDPSWLDLLNGVPQSSFELPCRSVNAYEQTIVNNTIALSPATSINYRLAATCGLANTTQSLRLYVAAGDDFQLFDWVPPPPFYST